MRHSAALLLPPRAACEGLAEISGVTAAGGGDGLAGAVSFEVEDGDAGRGAPDLDHDFLEARSAL